MMKKQRKKGTGWIKGKKRDNFSTDHRIKIGLNQKGKNNHNWKGGVMKKNYSNRLNIMKSIEYKLWRKTVFVRDNYTCIWCGYKGNRIQADHIKPFSQFPELRFAIDNGRTLCIECHKKTDTWGINQYFTP